jgi:hypothetical protein
MLDAVPPELQALCWALCGSCEEAARRYRQE